jgi:hypothetical protein
MTSDSPYSVRPPTNVGQVANLVAVNASDDSAARHRQRNGKKDARRDLKGGPAKAGAGGPPGAKPEASAGTAGTRAAASHDGKATPAGDDHIDILI